MARNNFPFGVQVTLAKSGTTHVIVKLDDIIVQEVDY
jgi:hypothetical protein